MAVLSRRGCVRCDAVVRWWARHGVDVELVDVDRHPSLVAVMVAQGLTSLPVSVVREDGATWGSFLGRPARAFLDTATEVWSGVDPERIHAWAARARRAEQGGGMR